MRLVVNNIKLPIQHKTDDILAAIVKQYHVDKSKISNLKIVTKSIDARFGDVKYIYSVEVNIENGNKLLNNKKNKNLSLPKDVQYVFPEKKYSGRPIIIGAGPAGLFCAYLLVEMGIVPVIIERGNPVETRTRDVEEFWKTGLLNPESNVQFGEGGAGTFSDGKLNTLVKDRGGRCSLVMNTFVRFGAPENILYDSKPHVGTDILVNVVKNMREYIKERGGEFLFGTKVTGFIQENAKISGVVVEKDNNTSNIYSDRVVLAIGHSARDTFEMLDKTGIVLEPKSFAVGLRVEHPREYIDSVQYGNKYQGQLPAASYKLTAQTSFNRGVYSFCMCPGGYVVNASSEPERLAVNGMSYSGRDGANSNTAVIVTVTPEDFPDSGNLAGVWFQRSLESKAYKLGKSKIPAMRYGDFKKSVLGSDSLQDDKEYLSSFEPQNKGGHIETDITGLLPLELNKSLIEGMELFGKKIRGYNSKFAYLSGVESRTSSPVKILRDENGISPSLMGLYPCGEGAGYAGGITSAAMDGIYIAERIISNNEL